MAAGGAPSSAGYRLKLQGAFELGAGNRLSSTVLLGIVIIPAAH